MKLVSTILVSIMILCSLHGQEFYHQSSEVEVEGTFGFPIWDGCGGLSCADFNGDGLDDLTFGTEQGEDIVFLENKGDRFELVDPPFVSNIHETKQVLWADYDGDGDKDLIAATWDSYVYVYENDGNMNFTDVTSAVGLPLTIRNSFGVNVTDFNGDGLVEMYISNYGLNPVFENEMYTYNATTHAFDDISLSSMTDNGQRQSFTSVVFDFDLDGDLDFYIANDRPLFENTLYMNIGNLVFLDVSVPSMTNITIDAMNAGVGDADMDGDMDIYVTNGVSQGAPLSAYLRNNGVSGGGVTFTDIAQTNGTEFDRLGWGGIFVDIDNDRDEDLYVCTSSTDPNALFINDGTGNFTEPLYATNGMHGQDTLTTFSNGYGDFNNDGLIDLVLGHGYVSDDFSVYYNHEKNDNNYIKLHIEGTSSNIDAYGTRIVTWIDGVSTITMKHSTNGFISQHSDYINIGIGNATSVDSLKITWPYFGSKETIYGADILVNGTSHILEGSGVVATYQNPICKPNHSLQVNPIASQNYGASQNLDSHSTILSGADVHFQAESQISLDIDFEVEAGAVFEAEIDECGN